MIKAKVNQFKNVVSNLSGNMAIFATAFDLDAVVSGLALKHILENINKDLRIDIFYGGDIGSSQSRAIVATYNLNEYISQAKYYKKESYQYVALVDSSNTTDARCEGVNDIDPVIVIDHHRESHLTESENKFFWIDNVNATATLITELAHELKINFPSYLMALLALAIHSDTKAFEKAENREYKALAWLTQKEGVSFAVGKQIAYTLPQSYYEQELLAHNNKVREESWLITSLEFIPGSDGDNIGMIADKFARQEGLTLVIAWAIIDNSYVRVSVRSSDVIVPIGEIMQRFGASSGFKTTSNGKTEGGARITLESLKPWFTENTKKELLALVSKYINSTIFQNKKAP